MESNGGTLVDLAMRRYPPIEEYGIIGDLRTAALVGPNGSIDFLCVPRFDSPSVFCGLVDHDRGGRFQILPLLEDARQKKLYLPDTNILLSRFLSDDGVAEISDFMALAETDCGQAVVRRAKSVRGEIAFRMICQPRFDYARASHRIERREKEIVFVSEGSDRIALRLRSDVPLRVVDGDAIAEFRLRTGQTASFVLEPAVAGRDDLASAGGAYCSQAFKRTHDFWHHWIARSLYRGRWREAVNRSALALKLLTSREFGSIVAAPCFGLPNEIGGERNWDYRYTWIRDAAFTLYALMRLGFTEEASAFMTWLEARCQEIGEAGTLQIMYGIDGRRDVSEIRLDHLEGYRCSRPVRIGSTNYDQLQLDIYGELLDAVYMYNKFGAPISYDLWRQITRLVDWVCENWRRPDAGIWEVRGGDREFLYSRLMCWVAVDRGLRLARKRSLPAPVARWRRIRDRIFESVFRDHWSEERKAFVQFKGTEAMDASALIMPLVKFISPVDPRWISTLDAISEDLVYDSLVYRYRVGEAFSDELDGTEGTFSICSFWYVECISRMGDLQRARYLFEKMLGYANHLGLFSEQLGRRGEFLGNVPQAFTHLAMISAAFDLDRRLSKAGID